MEARNWAYTSGTGQTHYDRLNYRRLVAVEAQSKQGHAFHNDMDTIARL